MLLDEKTANSRVTKTYWSCWEQWWSLHQQGSTVMCLCVPRMQKWLMQLSSWTTDSCMECETLVNNYVILAKYITDIWITMFLTNKQNIKQKPVWINNNQNTNTGESTKPKHPRIMTNWTVSPTLQWEAERLLHKIQATRKYSISQLNAYVPFSCLMRVLSIFKTNRQCKTNIK